VVISVHFLRAPAIHARPGTNLLPKIPRDSLGPATAYEPARRYPRARRLRCHVHSPRPDAPARYAGALSRSTQELAGSALARSGDLASHGLPRRYDEPGRLDRATRLRVDDFRSAIRGYSE